MPKFRVVGTLFVLVIPNFISKLGIIDSELPSWSAEVPRCRNGIDWLPTLEMDEDEGCSKPHINIPPIPLCCYPHDILISIL